MKISCPDCSGRGILEWEVQSTCSADGCYGRGYTKNGTCSNCNGYGHIIEKHSCSCSRCSGSGLIDINDYGS